MPNTAPLTGAEPGTLSQQTVPSPDWVLGTYGFYEAIDFTTRRIPSPEQGAIVPIDVTHHQGMVMLSLVNCLKGQVMVHRFHADLRIQTVELLLWEAPILYPNTKARDEGLSAPIRA
jgi:hypothetical protein